jgi:hypothetical protein
MATEVFSKAQFEDALPKDKTNGRALWRPMGLTMGEYCYLLPVKTGVFITVRSSVGANGYCAETGADSIRAWLTDVNGEALGVKVQKYVTRMAGWQGRMIIMLRKLWALAAQLKTCPKCGETYFMYRVKKDGPTKGRLFQKCRKCDDGFEWMKE